MAPTVLESLTYWLRLEDILSDTSIDDRLIDQARLGLNSLQEGQDMAEWIRESESLLRDVEHRIRDVASETPELLSIGRAAPAVESLRAVLSATAGPRRASALVGAGTQPVPM